MDEGDWVSEVLVSSDQPGARVRFLDADMNEVPPPGWWQERCGEWLLAEEPDDSPEAEAADGSWDRAFDAHVDRGLGL